ncbi:MAG: hypothetical protein S4CHLAM6_03150 [Chlamydiae bacterium]|nr:hypothetical protein [Chlamydiota bacterium]
MGQSNIQPDKQPEKSHQRLSPAELQRIRNKKVEKKSDISGVAMIYKTMAQLMTLVSTCHDVTPVSGSKGVASTGPVVANQSDPAQSIGHLVQAMQSKEFETHPNQFYQKVFLATMDCSEIDSPAIKALASKDLQSLFASSLSDATSKKGFALSMANAYRQLSHQSKNTTVLQMCLNLLMGSEHPLVDTTLKTYKNCVTTHNEIPNIKKLQKQVATTLGPFQVWNQQYSELMSDLNKGKFSIQKVVNVVESAPKGAKHQMETLSRVIKPLIKSSSSQKEISKLLVQHFSQTSGANDPQKLFLAFVQKMQTAFPDDCKQGCQAIEAMGSNQLKASTSDGPGKVGQDSASQAPSKVSHSSDSVFHSWEHSVIHHEPIMMAMYVLLMSGSGSYGFLAKIMANLGVSMANIKKFVSDMKAIQDDMNDLMSNKSVSMQEDDARAIWDAQNNLNGLIKTYGSKLGSELRQSLSNFSNSGGSLDQVVSEATKGMSTPLSNWKDASASSDAVAAIQKYLTGPGGGAAPAGVTTVFKNMSDLMGSLNTQNQADVEKLNLTTKKVDSLTKLFAASVTMYKGLNQTLTNYSST